MKNGPWSCTLRAVFFIISRRFCGLRRNEVLREITMKALLLLCTLLGPPCQVYPTVAASDAWLTATRQLPLKRQVAALRQRLACDARVRGRVFTTSVCTSCLTAEGRRAYQAAQEKQRHAEAADPRPPGITLLYLLDGRIVAAVDTAQWQPVITRQRVREISFLESAKATAIGGTRAQDGLVIITTKKP